MAKLTKATITKAIQARTGLSRRKAQKGLNTVLKTMREALRDGKKIELPRIGRLELVQRKRKRTIRKNLRGSYRSSVLEIHKKHPNSVRLLGGKDMSDDPKPTIVHKKEEVDPVPARFRHIAIAFPAWRRRHRLR
jgi:nucleoid DNA-binding protein